MPTQKLPYTDTIDNSSITFRDKPPFSPLSQKKIGPLMEESDSSSGQTDQPNDSNFSQTAKAVSVQFTTEKYC